jgi:anti-sigma B factor antagonist
MAWTERQPGLRCDVRRAGEWVSVRLAGELDLASQPVAWRVLESARGPGRHVMLDLSRVTFLDAAGLRFLRDARQHARDEGWNLAIARPHPAVRRLLVLTQAQTMVGLGLDAGAPPLLSVGEGVPARCAEAVEVAMRGGADMVNVQLRDQAGALRIVAQEGFRRPFLDFFEVVDDTESACGVALGSGRSVWVSDVARSGIFAGAPSLSSRCRSCPSPARRRE